MLDKHVSEIQRNFDFFQSVVPSIMDEHAGKMALIHDCIIVGYFDSPGEAVKAGADRFGDLPFSVQRVIDRPIDIGFLSHATDHGISVPR